VTRPRDRPASLGTLLVTSRAAAARYAGTAIDREQWRRLVGEKIAARTEPGAKRGRELTVYVASASWAQELSLLVNEIVSRLKSVGVDVDTVRFRVRAIDAPVRDAAAAKPSARRAPLPSELHRKLGTIEDEELRDAIADAAGLWLAREEPAPTSARPGARSPRDEQSQNARSDRTSPPVRGARRDKT